MALQILRRTAAYFAPDAGSNISLDLDHLKCDNYILGDNAGPQLWGGIARRDDGGFRAISHVNWNNIYKYDANLNYLGSSAKTVAAPSWVYGTCVDDENYLYFSHSGVNPVQKYADDGTWQWNFNGSAGINSGKGMFFYNNRIFVVSWGNHRVYEMDKNGNEIHTRLLNGDDARLTYPDSIFVDSTGIYIHCRGGIGVYDLTWNFQSVIDTEFTNTISTRTFWDSTTCKRKTNGNFILFNMNPYSLLRLIEIDNSGVYVRGLNVFGKSHPEMGEEYNDSGIDKIVLSSDNNTLWLSSRYHSRIIQFDLRNASERFAEYQYNFGQSVNIRRLSVNALYDNRDESWKSMRLWYQLDAGGWNEVDMKNPLLNINGQVLDLKVGMTSYGFLRHWPEFYSLDIVYDDGAPAPNYPKKLDVRAI